MNRIIIAGRLSKEPELKTTNSGTEVCNFTVAVDRRVKRGEEKKTDFIDCTAWGKSGAFVSTYFKKGDGITVDGRLESRKWQDNSGNNRVSWGVTCDNIEFPFGKSGGASSSFDPATFNNAIPTPDFQAIGDDEEVPF